MKGIFKMNIKHLDDLIIHYFSNFRDGKTENLQNMRQEIERLFDVLENPDKDNVKKDEIKQMIFSKIEDQTLTYLELTTLFRELLIHGYK